MKLRIPFRMSLRKMEAAPSPGVGRHYRRVYRYQHKNEVADDMIRVGVFGTPPVYYHGMHLREGTERVDIRSVDPKSAVDALLDRIVFDRHDTRVKAPDTVGQVLREMIECLVHYGEALDVRMTEKQGLGVFFLKVWPYGQP